MTLEQEPVAYLSNKRQRINIEIKPQTFVDISTVTDWEMPLYMKPPQRTWVGLTDDEIDLLEELYAPPVHPDFVNDADHCLELIRHIEAKLKEKNT
jgi:hypothetical protein